MADSVTAESSLFWKLEIEPTRFPGFFCEPVARIFESEPEPCSRHDHMWRCSLIETMTNGQVTIDINVQRIHVKDCALRQNILQSTTSEEDVFLDSATAQQVPPQYPQHPQHQRSSFGDDGQGDQEWLPKIYYKTIALHIPRKLAPITFMIFSGGAMAVQLEAETVLHRGKYQFEFVFSEESTMYHIPSPSSCLRILDSLFHEVVATSLPNPQTANIWFDFPTQASNESQTNLSTRPPSWYVTTVAAHEEVLRRYPKLAEWIDRERAAQEQARRYQLQEEWKTHLQERSRPSTYPTLTLLPLSEQSSGYGFELTETEGHNYDPGRRRRRRSVGGRDPQFSDSKRQSPQSSFPPAGDLTLTECPLEREDNDCELQEQLQSGRHHVTQQRFSETVEAQACSESLPHQRHQRQQPPGFIFHVDQQENQRQRQQYPPDHSPSRHPPSDVAVLPALRIVVTDITLGTFQTMLQFLYTSQIGISEEQEYEIDVYWNDNPEDHHIISPDSQSQEGFEPVTLPDPLGPLTHYPGVSFFQRLITAQESYPSQGAGIGDERRAFGSRFSGTPAYASPIHGISSASALSSWLPCSRRNQRLSSRAGSSSSGNNSNSGSDNTAGEVDYASSGGSGSNIYMSSSCTSNGSTPGYRPCCSWENLLQVAWRFQLKELQTLSMKAIEYHCQMMAIRSSINSNVMAEAANAFDEAKLDLQLAWGEQVLCSFLRLYNNSPRVRISEQGLTVDTGEKVSKPSTREEEGRTEDTFSWSGFGAGETSSSDASAEVVDVQSQQGGNLAELKATQPLEEEEDNVLMKQRNVAPSVIYQSQEARSVQQAVSQSRILQRDGSPLKDPHQRLRGRVQSFPGRQRSRQHHGAVASSLLATSNRQLQQRLLQEEGRSSSHRVTEPLGVTRAQVRSQLSQKRTHTEARDESSSADSSGRNTTGGHYHASTEQCEPHQSLFESPVCEQGILELCQNIRSRYLRMRDILDE